MNQLYDCSRVQGESLRLVQFKQTFTALSYQFTFTFFSVLAIAMSDLLKFHILENLQSLLFISIVGSISTILYGIFNRDTVTEKFLAVFTLFETLLVSIPCAIYSADIVFLSVATTLAITVGLVSYSMTTNNNHVEIGDHLRSMLSVLLLMGIFNFFFQSEFLFRIDLYLGTLVFIGYIIFDVQYYFRVNATFKHNDHIWAALNIYLDVINIFIRLLEIYNRLFGDRKNKSKDE